MRYIVKDGQRVPLGGESPPPPPQSAASDPRPPTLTPSQASPTRDQLASLLDTLTREVEQHHGTVEQLWEQLRRTLVNTPPSEN